MFPIYKGTYERYVRADEGTTAEREMEIACLKDFSRSIDYLETRPELDHDKLAYYGVSFGSRISSIILAIDKRPKTAVLVGGGFRPEAQLPEISEINYAPRVKIPVVMINGRYDFIFPWQTSQNPMFRLLGTRGTDRRHAMFDAGHIPPRNDIIREALAWLDRYLGSVK
jgi:eukaryotic-like serine/threonine-protein kinase